MANEKFPKRVYEWMYGQPETKVEVKLEGSLPHAPKSVAPYDAPVLDHDPEYIDTCLDTCPRCGKIKSAFNDCPCYLISPTLTPANVDLGKALLDAITLKTKAPITDAFTPHATNLALDYAALKTKNEELVRENKDLKDLMLEVGDCLDNGQISSAIDCMRKYCEDRS